ncbi:SLATT domain-containing protein [Streptomyces sp. NBC_01498]|uniref:SLATT domain-containing protein n=1 Tax=Streptomyces sp. NBC_01498 TaxID=2975870 RepID=UPI002E7B4F50|nr:SLATT domain-containing protein [Streptomyces sp. NBC_01498]WTL25519.1 SLATT domain-containing protein [Streptomyces sp. NBC_01498]
MSQPDMPPGGPARDEGARGAPESVNGSGGGVYRAVPGALRWGPGGTSGEPLAGAPGGVFPGGDWSEPAQRLDELYRWAEAGALRAVARCRAERVRKRRRARALRSATALGVITGAVLPLLDLTDVLDERATGWGYLSLLLAVACLGCDRYFGLTSGWLRNVATAQAVERRLQALHYDWASECVREVLGPAEGTASEAAERCLGVLRRFSEDVSDLVRAETADWMAEFRGGSVPPPAQPSTGCGGPARPDGGHPPGRFPLPPGTRPNMPRQRPPDVR